MNIGILTHCIAINFGANLQAFSIAEYIKKRGDVPFFLQWDTYINDFIDKYKIITEQAKQHKEFLSSKGFYVSSPCYTYDDFVKIVKDNNIELLIVGSDAVLTINSWIDNFYIDRHGFHMRPTPKDYTFPNPFWVPFYNQISNTRLALLSPSCQSTDFLFLPLKVKKDMGNCLRNFSYISARDSYTGTVIRKLIKRKDVQITPDPVFSFNENIEEKYKLNKQEILEKFNLPDKYILFSFYGDIKKEWLQKCKDLLNKNGYYTVLLPMPEDSPITCLDKKINLPLNPIDWYYLIKYSSGYIGHNMHPVIVSIHNNVPFISIDQHGKRLFIRRIQFSKTSKVYDLLKRHDMLKYRVTAAKYQFTNPEVIIKNLLNFDSNKEKCMANKMQENFINMMNEILQDKDF